MKDFKSKIEKLEHKLRIMKEYIQIKFTDEDWHGIMDASVDIREIEIELNLLKRESNNEASA